MTRIETAVEILTLRPPTLVAYQTKFRNRLLAMGVREQPQADPLRVHINAGRWATPCVCGSSVASHPEWQWSGCLLCGRSWSTVVFPSAEDLAAIDAVLSKRPARRGHQIPYRFYSWQPGETIEDLLRQNARIDAVVGVRG